MTVYLAKRFPGRAFHIPLKVRAVVTILITTTTTTTRTTMLFHLTAKAVHQLL